MQKEITGYSSSDEETRAVIREAQKKHGYLLDPYAPEAGNLLAELICIIEGHSGTIAI